MSFEKSDSYFGISTPQSCLGQVKYLFKIAWGECGGKKGVDINDSKKQISVQIREEAHASNDKQ